MNLEEELNRSWTLYSSGVPLFHDRGRLAVDEPLQLQPTPAPGLMTPDAMAVGDAPAPTFGNEFARGAMRAIGGGIRDTAQQVIDLGADLIDNQAAMDNRPTFARQATKDLLPNFDPDSMVEGIARVGVNIVSALMLTRTLGIGGGAIGNVASGAIVDALMDPEEGNLSTLAKEFGFQGELLDFLDNKVAEDAGPEERLRARLLGVMEGVGIGGLINGVINGFRVVKNNPEAAAKVAGGLAAAGVAFAPEDAEGASLSKVLRQAKGAAPTAAGQAGEISLDAITIAPATSAQKALQLEPQYRVIVEGAPEPVGRGQYITNAINPRNVRAQSQRLDEIAQQFPDPLSDERAWSLMQTKVYNSREVPLPPGWLIEHVNDMPKWSAWMNRLTPEQIRGAADGFGVAADFKKLYASGATVETTGHLMLWSILSRRMSAFPHESAFLDIAEAAQPFIAKAARGDWTPADVDAWRAMVQSSIPDGSPGRSGISNANAFGDTFLTKMAEKGSDGRTKLQMLHDMIADPNMTGPQIRREFYGLAEDVGIRNKVLSFALLVSGRDDVMVLDRIQLNQMFGGGKKIYDDIYQLFDNGPGLATYEALERSLAGRVKELYTAIGRPQDASVGRYHWETWVLTSGQVVEHPTLKTIVKSGAGDAAPFANTPVAEGRFHSKAFGATYEKLPGGGEVWTYRTQDGTPYRFSKPELDAMFAEAMDKKKGGVVPSNFPGVSAFEGTDAPWFQFPGVNRDRLDEYIRQYGKPARP